MLYRPFMKFASIFSLVVSLSFLVGCEENPKVDGQLSGETDVEPFEEEDSNGDASVGNDNPNSDTSSTTADGAGNSDESTTGASSDNANTQGDVTVSIVKLGDLPPGVMAHFVAYLEKTGEVVRIFESEIQMEEFFREDNAVETLRATIVFRDASNDDEGLTSEGYRVTSEAGALGVQNIIVEGKAKIDPRPYHNIGLAFGAYRLLENVGYRFLHPLEPLRMNKPIDWSGIQEIETSPRWPFRHVSVHTMHPLEFTDMLQGLNSQSETQREGWEALLPEWHQYMDWLLANGQNQTGWVTLRTGHDDFDYSDERFDRMRVLVDIAHSYGIRVGCGLPLVQKQQHAWHLIDDVNAPLDEQMEQLTERARLAMGAGFDIAGVALGTTEFTATDPERTIAWLNRMLEVIEVEFGAEMSSTAHITAEQEVDVGEGEDALNGENFNFITRFTEGNIRASAHTVQHYSLDDPAPTYGNESFEHMRQFMRDEAGRRLVHYSPESAYWVSFDVDVPLFLPLYAERRFHDLRLIVEDEEAGLMGQGEYAGTRITGQSLFTTGWEWGYWFNEIVAARAAWSPTVEGDEAEAFRALLNSIFEPFPEGDAIAEWIIDLAAAQHELLIHGQIDGVDNWDVVEKNAQAYLQGTETWDDISELAEQIPGVPLKSTQPTRIGPLELLDPRVRFNTYPNRIRPLLESSRNRFRQSLDNIESLRAEVLDSEDASASAGWIKILNEFRDAIEITSLRSRQVLALYEYRADPLFQADASLLREAQSILDEGLNVSARREQSYRVDAERIAAWRFNPTAYPYTYLWSARSLFYWWRDEGLFTHMSPNPCYLNVIDPVDIALGEDMWMTAADAAALVFDRIPGLGEISGCIDVDESTEPNFRTLVRGDE